MSADRARPRTPRRRGDAEPQTIRPVAGESLAWRRLTAAVAEAISVLVPGQCLVLSAKRRGYWVHLVADGRGGLHAEASSNAWLKARDELDRAAVARLGALGWAPPTLTREEVEATDEGLEGSSNFTRFWPAPAPLVEAATLLTTTLREVYGIRRPGQLEYTAFGPGLKEILLPTLGLANAPLPDDDEDDEHGGELLQPENPEELLAAVVETLRSFSDLEEVVSDEDGDIPLRYGNTLIFVRVAADAPYVELFSPVARGVEPTLELLKALNDLTGHHRQVGFFISGDTVYASLDLVADPFVPDHVGASLAVLGELCDDVGPDLRQRFGGHAPLEPAPRKQAKRRRARYN
jgi:hypothetical protein